MIGKLATSLLSLATSCAFVLQAAAATYAEVAPILAARCVVCHSGSAAVAGLRLDSLDGILAGSARGPVVTAGSPDDSELLRRIRGTSLPRMPMTGPPFLSDDETALVERWIADGLPAGNETGATAAATATASVPVPRAGEPVTFLHVAPIFARRCASCHTDGGRMGPPPEGYRLTSLASVLASDDRVRVVPGNPAASELLRRVRGQSLPRMPFDGPPYLDAEEERLVEQWIAQGARDADGIAATVPAGGEVRLHGVLRRGWRLDDLPLAVGRRTRIDKNPRAGNYVEVRGRLDGDGRVIAERIRARDRND